MLPDLPIQPIIYKFEASKLVSKVDISCSPWLARTQFFSFHSSKDSKKSISMLQTCCMKSHYCTFAYFHGTLAPVGREGNKRRAVI